MCYGQRYCYYDFEVSKLLMVQVAVRSEEPYKLQGYTILKSLSAPDYISDPDAMGRLQASLCLLLAPQHATLHCASSHCLAAITIVAAAVAAASTAVAITA